MSPEALVVDQIVERYSSDASSLIMVLQDVQAALNYLPPAAIDQVARRLDVPRSQVYSVASFYKGLSLEPQGKHKVDVCMGTACHVRGAGILLNQLSGHFGIEPGQTTEDREVTLKSVHCVGACALGPLVVIDGEYYGEMNPTKLTRTVKKCCSADAACTCPEEEIAPAVVEVPDLPLFTDPAALEAHREHLIQETPLETPSILVCAGTGCIANNALKVADALERELAEQGAAVTIEMGIKKTGCHGFCEKGPLLVFHPADTCYTRVKERDVAEIVEKTVLGGEVISRLLYKDLESGEPLETYHRIPFYAGQQRNVLRNIGRIDPESLDDYLAHGGYTALARALTSMSPATVIGEVERSGLRGCGGGGFPTGRKWRSCVEAEGDERYLICNGDEGDPGAFMDRSIMEGDPFAVLEGMSIGAYAIGASQGYIYVREEYPLAVARLEAAIREATVRGLLGDRILGSDFSFRIEINRGGGAFVCGESTALMQSVAGKVGEPRAKYIRSVERGLHDQPTVLNNVETFANVPLILEKGADWFAAQGTEKSKGTKAFALVGKVKNTGLVEVPMGATLRSIIYDIGGGILDDRPFKAVQTGGPSGGCLPASKLDLQVDFDTLTSEGSMMGSGGMIVMDEATCMVDVARYFTSFLSEESCGKCAACRLGLDQLKGILEKICAGNGVPEDLPAMEQLFTILDEGSLCGLGTSAANPVRSTLAHFRAEYEAHINEKKCPAGVCRALITYDIDPESCTGCAVCARACPQKAIIGEKKEIHVLDASLCDRCGICSAVCKFGSVVTV